MFKFSHVRHFLIELLKPTPILIVVSIVIALSDPLKAHFVLPSTRDGSAPYNRYRTLSSFLLPRHISFAECRISVAPVYSPRAADVLSLGIVVIIMCAFRFPKISSFLGSLTQSHQLLHAAINRRGSSCGKFLVENVFCVLDDPTDDSQRIGTCEFGIWVRDFSTLMAASQSAAHTYSRVPPPTSIATGYPVASASASRRPSSRQPSIAGGSLLLFVPSLPGPHGPCSRR